MFQFHSGSIQTQAGMEEYFIRAGFNSTLVRFKQTIAKHSETALSTFQFHSGSIQTQTFISAMYKRAEFQFHSGSIQTVTKKAAIPERYIVSIPLWFDSNLLDEIEKMVAARFQFHSGSIQT